jgi:hypothetical protein
MHTKTLNHIKYIYLAVVTRSQWLVLLLFITSIIIIPDHAQLFMERSREVLTLYDCMSLIITVYIIILVYNIRYIIIFRA